MPHSCSDHSGNAASVPSVMPNQFVQNGRIKKKKRKRRNVGFYGYDPSINIIAGDPRLSPPPAWFGVNYHPSQPISNSWQEWSGADAQMFDISANRSVPLSRDSQVVQEETKKKKIKRRKQRHRFRSMDETEGGRPRKMSIDENPVIKEGTANAKVITLHPFQPTRNEWTDWKSGDVAMNSSNGGGESPITPPTPLESNEVIAPMRRKNTLVESISPQPVSRGSSASTESSIAAQRTAESLSNININPVAPAEGIAATQAQLIAATSAVKSKGAKQLVVPKPKGSLLQVKSPQPRAQISSTSSQKKQHTVLESQRSVMSSAMLDISTSTAAAMYHVPERKYSPIAAAKAAEVAAAAALLGTNDQVDDAVLRNKNLSKLNRMRKFMYEELINSCFAHLEESISLLKQSISSTLDAQLSPSNNTGKETTSANPDRERGLLGQILAGEGTLAPLHSHKYCVHPLKAKKREATTPASAPGFDPEVARDQLIKQLRDRMNTRRVSVASSQSGELRSSLSQLTLELIEVNVAYLRRQLMANTLVISHSLKNTSSNPASLSKVGALQTSLAPILESLSPAQLEAFKIHNETTECNRNLLLREQIKLLAAQRLLKSSGRLLFGPAAAFNNNCLNKILTPQQLGKLVGMVATRREDFLEGSLPVDCLFEQLDQVIFVVQDHPEIKMEIT